MNTEVRDTRTPRTQAGRALLDKVAPFPTIGEMDTPEAEWVGDAVAFRNEVEGRILAIEDEAAAFPAPDRGLDVERLAGAYRALGMTPQANDVEHMGDLLAREYAALSEEPET